MPTLARLCVLQCILILSFVAGICAESDEIPIEKDVVYGHASGVDLKLDLARPPTGNGPFPLIVCVHGGAWQAGDKAGHQPTIRMLAKHGYVAATVEYRFAPQFKFPAQIEDVKCAVRYLRSRAGELKIKPDRVGAMGESAGGHLVLMLGLLDPKDGLEGGGGHPEQSSKIQAVVNFFGPTDFSQWRVITTPDEKTGTPGVKAGTEDGILDAVFGTSDRNSAVLRTASPITYVNPGDPPILTFQGAVDPLVPADQARILHEKLKKTGVKEELVILEGESHGWGSEKMEKSRAKALTFFDEVLKAPAEK